MKKENKSIHLICSWSKVYLDGNSYLRFDEAYLNLENAQKKLIELENEYGEYSHEIYTVPLID